MTVRRGIGVSAGLVVAFLTARARGDEPFATDAAMPAKDRPTATDDATTRTIDRTWLYVDDARVATPLVFVGTTNVSYTRVGNSPSRIVGSFPGCPAPCNRYNSFAGNTATPGATVDVGGEVGLLPRLSVVALGQIGFGGSDSAPSPSAGVVAGLRFQVLPSDSQTHLVLSGGYLREAWQGPRLDDNNVWHPGSASGDNGAWMQASISQDIRRLRLAGTVHGEHVFADGRDATDIMVQAGASYRLAGDFRAGVEYVGQDIEETFVPASERGSRHFAGPIASLQLLNQRLSLVAGPAIGLTTRSPDVLGRFALSYAF